MGVKRVFAIAIGGPFILGDGQGKDGEMTHT